MEIYLDIVILENIVINYLILSVTARLSKNKAGSPRLLLGSVLGTVYLVLMILLPGVKAYTAVFSKVLLSAGMVAVTFRFGSLKSFLKTLALFYASTFLFAGAGFALMFFRKDRGIMKNGVVMTPVSLLDTTWAELLLAVAVTLIIIRVVFDAVQSRFLKEKLLVTINISFDRKSKEVPALVDTGNSLHDPLSNMPVVVVEFAAIRDLLPDDIRSIFEQDTESDLKKVTAVISRSDWFSRFRLIPFSSLGKENGMLIGFKPDYIEIGEEDGIKGVDEVIVGIYNKALSKTERYRALVNPELM